MQLLDMMSFIKTPEALRDLNKVISDYFVRKADEEMDRMWKAGTLNEESIVTEDNHFNILKTIPFPKVEVVGIDDFKIYLERWLSL